MSYFSDLATCMGISTLPFGLFGTTGATLVAMKAIQMAMISGGDTTLAEAAAAGLLSNEFLAIGGSLTLGYVLGALFGCALTAGITPEQFQQAGIDTTGYC